MISQAGYPKPLSPQPGIATSNRYFHNSTCWTTRSGPVPSLRNAATALAAPKTLTTDSSRVTVKFPGRIARRFLAAGYTIGFCTDDGIEGLLLGAPASKRCVRKQHFSCPRSSSSSKLARSGALRVAMVFLLRPIAQVRRARGRETVRVHGGERGGRYVFLRLRGPTHLINSPLSRLGRQENGDRRISNDGAGYSFGPILLA